MGDVKEELTKEELLTLAEVIGIKKVNVEATFLENLYELNHSCLRCNQTKQIFFRPDLNWESVGALQEFFGKEVTWEVGPSGNGYMVWNMDARIEIEANHKDLKMAFARFFLEWVKIREAWDK